MAGSLPMRPVQVYVFHFTVLPGRFFFQNTSPGPKPKNVRCSFGKSRDIGSELGFLVAGLLRAFKMVIMCGAVSRPPRLPLQLGSERDYWCELDHAQRDTTSLVLYCPSGVASSQLSPLWALVSSRPAECVERPSASSESDVSIASRPLLSRDSGTLVCLYFMFLERLLLVAFGTIPLAQIGAESGVLGQRVAR